MLGVFLFASILLTLLVVSLHIASIIDFCCLLIIIPQYIRPPDIQVNDVGFPSTGSAVSTSYIFAAALNSNVYFITVPSNFGFSQS